MIGIRIICVGRSCAVRIEGAAMLTVCQPVHPFVLVQRLYRGGAPRGLFLSLPAAPAATAPAWGMSGVL